MLLAAVLSGCPQDSTPPKHGRFGQPNPRPKLVGPSVEAPEIAKAAIAPTVVELPPTLPAILRGPRQIDSFRQDEAVVDVLWVVDNSGSLSNERARLASEFDRFLSVLLAAQVDFHVGVTSTDLSPTGDQGRLRGPVAVIDRNTINPVLAFQRAVTFPNDLEIALEEGLAAIESALSPPNTTGPNAGFLRDNAALAVIVVSDEDDGSLGPTDHYLRFLEGLKGPGRDANVSLSAVVGPVPDGCVAPGEENIFGAEARAAERYIAVAEGSGGLIESICSLNFAPFVQALATSLAGLRRFFPLSSPPDVDSIRVEIDGRRIAPSETNGWVYRPAAQAIELSGMAVPPPGAEVRIAYDVQL